MRINISLFGLVLALLALQSCANYKLKYSSEGAAWENNLLPVQAPEHTVYLIGDAGGGKGSALTLLEKKLREDKGAGTVVFLGDNIYPNGLGPVEAEDRTLDEKRLNDQLDVVKDYKGNVHFIAGNHDWYKYGLAGVKRQKKYIEKYLDREDVFFPKPGCGEPKEIDLNDNLVLILIDSQWYLEDWDDEYKINSGCEIKSREVFQEYVLEAIKGNRNKNIIIAMHHPPYTNGPHGGNFTLRQHLFPLTDVNKNLYIPLPILGTGLQFLRGSIGHKQDAIHPNYSELSDIIISNARKNGNFVIASGHEHSLQYMENDEQFFVVSGAGSKQSPSRLGNNAEFVYGNQGFAKLYYYEDGTCWIEFWAADEAGDGRVVYRKKVKGPLPDVVDTPPVSFPPMPKQVNKPLSKDDFDKGKLWSFFWGDHYRKAYGTEFTIPALDLSTFKGGVKPVKRGGGFQTNSLRLQAKDGKQYVMRSIDKDASRTLAWPFNESILTEVLKDNFSASHPLAAIAVASLAKKAGVYFSQPKLYYVPPQEGLGIYNDDFAGALYLVEERPDDDLWKDAPQFGNSDDIKSTLSMVESVMKKQDEIVDYRWVVKSRLFDVLIGDWDRHDDQWRWAKIDTGKISLYRPIPRDRDQAFCNYDGLILALAKGAGPDVKKLLVYRDKASNMKWMNYNGRHFDHTFLSGAGWDIWEEEARALQSALTDEVIEAAFKNEWPSEVYELDGPNLIAKTKARRDDLIQITRSYYELMSKKVNVVGTQGKDLFLIERLDNKGTRVRIFDTNSKGEKKHDAFFDRTFYPGETKEIILYGLKNEDIFEIKGNTKGNTVKVRIIGGLGKDELVDDSDGRSIVYYDTKGEPSLIDNRTKANIRLKDDVLYNTYDRESNEYDYNYLSFLPYLNFNPDDRFLLGGVGSYTTYGFKKEPFASRHNFSLAYALATGGVRFNYSGELIDVIGKWELALDLNMQTPLYAINYYGIGNDSQNPEIIDDVDDLDFNRVKQRVVEVFPGFMRRLNDHSRLVIGPTYEAIRIERTANRYIDEIADELNPEIFDGIKFVGGRFLLDYKNTDNAAMPSRGVGFYLNTGWKTQLENTDKNYSYLDASFTVYQHLDRSRLLTLASRLGFQHRFNEDYEFYQGASLGGPGPAANFRGFRRNRFIGSTAFWQNTDIRWKMLTSGNPTIPFSIGLIAGFDHGRVWYQEENGNDSDTWHYSYGGGFWISPFDMFALNVSVFRGDNEQSRVIVGGGFFF